MANELQPLSLLFQNRLFRIPDYQRGYAWQQSQLVDFWDDLTNLQEGRYHYTGLLSLKVLKSTEIKCWGSDLWMVNKGFNPCHIVDGQQRLTTFIILLNEIVGFTRSLDCNSGKSDDEIVLGYDTLKDVVAKYICKHRPPNNQITTYLFGYEVDNPSADYLRYRIFNEPFSGTVNETYYTKNLKYAKSFFSENLAALYKTEGAEVLNNLYLKLTLRFMFNIHEIADDYDVFVAFETMNNRGKKLTNLELLKNRLIYLTTLYPDDKFDEMDKSNLRDQINDAWKEVYYQLGRNEKTPLSDDEFLRAHWISYFTYSRKKGDDYIHFLLNKFSAKNIFEKKTFIIGETLDEDVETVDYDIEDTADELAEPEVFAVSKLELSEISAYVNSLKDTAKYWYDTFFPMQSDNLSQEEKLWVDRLNRIGIGYFRPLVMVIISRRDLSAEQRIDVFKAIERFIFICFRLGYFNATFRSSEYYRAARSIYLKQMNISNLVEDITETTNANIEYALPNFITKIEKHFDNMGGFYYWNSIKYFLYEYELHLAQKNNLDKVSWEMFTKTEKDKVSIEHILPQTPTKYYWRNQFRQFDDEEIELLSCALGNLLPLSQSINSSLQNDSFEDKKTSKSSGRRGYQNGSHSEIEVSKETDWSADRIYQRSKSLLKFMESRWQFSYTSDQLDKLIYVTFAVDGREIPAPIAEKTENVPVKPESQNSLTDTNQELSNQQLMFWTKFVKYCEKENRAEDMASRKPCAQNWYDIPVTDADFHLSFTLTRGKYLSLVIYAYNGEVFSRLESKKDIIENVFGDKLDWYSSKRNSVAKRILYKRECEIFNPAKQQELFSWMIAKFDELCSALVIAGELDE
ncbi:MAG: DUF4268 domain-containing protein [Eubacteriales bacterium]|nr:DUF4268 domain-containing protein [Eubacteriales bacterium]